ncbi:MAG TPA: HIRAN domain-containing protein [Actinomycetota bacterium]|nr:HIRAN domain-containing protein [Actinomycetota bacterium]
MGLLDRFNKQKQLDGLAHQREKRAEATQRGDVVPIHFVEREWDKPDEGPDDIWGRGYVLRDDKGLNVYEDGPELLALEAIVTKVAGVSFYSDALQDPAFAPGQPLTLIPEPDNKYDATAVGVWDASSQLMVGRIPKELCGAVGDRINAGQTLRVMSIWEWVKKPSEERVGLKIFIGHA